MPTTTPHPKLQKSPLAEVVFELRWKLKAGEPGFEVDPGFYEFQTHYSSFALSGDYPKLEKLPIARVPEEMTPHVVRYRFRSDQNNGYPLTQIGPGILSVNDTANYKWEDFRPMILKSIDALYEKYPTNENTLEPERVYLKYINVIGYDNAGGSGVKMLQFLNEKLHTTLAINSPTFDATKQDTLGAFKLGLNYKLQNPKGIGDLTLGSITQNNKSSIRLEITIISKDEDVPKNKDDYEAWLNAAHETAHSWFSSLCDGELMTSFQ